MALQARIAKPRTGDQRLDATHLVRLLIAATQRVLRWVSSTVVDERTAYLSNATCHQDLERRIKAYDDYDRQRHLTDPR